MRLVYLPVEKLVPSYFGSWRLAQVYLRPIALIDELDIVTFLVILPPFFEVLICDWFTRKFSVINLNHYILIVVVFRFLLLLLLKLFRLSCNILNLEIVIVQRVDELKNVWLVFVEHFFLN